MRRCSKRSFGGPTDSDASAVSQLTAPPAGVLSNTVMNTSSAPWSTNTSTSPDGGQCQVGRARAELHMGDLLRVLVRSSRGDAGRSLSRRRRNSFARCCGQGCRAADQHVGRIDLVRNARHTLLGERCQPALRINCSTYLDHRLRGSPGPHRSGPQRNAPGSRRISETKPVPLPGAGSETVR